MQTEDKEEERNLPSLRTSLIAPVVTIVYWHYVLRQESILTL